MTIFTFTVFKINLSVRYVCVRYHYRRVQSFCCVISLSYILTRRYDTPCHSFNIPHSAHDTHSFIIRQPPIHHRTVYHLCFLPIVALSRHTQAFTCFRSCIAQHAHHRYIGAHRGIACSAQFQGRPIETFHGGWPRDPPGDWGYKLCICVPP